MHEVIFPYGEGTALVEGVDSPEAAVLAAALKLGERRLGRISGMCRESWVNVMDEEGKIFPVIQMHELLEQVKQELKALEECCREIAENLGLKLSEFEWSVFLYIHSLDFFEQYGQVA